MDSYEMRNRGRAIPSGRAGRPTARAMLRCLGYSATIAIASCNAIGPDLNEFEASDIQYSTVATIAKNSDWRGSALARKSLSDGRLTIAEYNAIMAEYDAAQNAQYAADKAAALREWGASHATAAQPERTGA